MTCFTTRLTTAVFGLAMAGALAQPAFAQSSAYDGMIAAHAAANGVPVSLVKRVIMRESRYNPHVVHAGNYGIMQIRLQTARSMGYTGTAQGLLDPDTNMTYAVKYLAGAYRVAGGDAARADRLYQTGYYYAAKRQGGERVARASRTQRVASAGFSNPFAGLFTPSKTRVRYVRVRRVSHSHRG